MHHGIRYACILETNAILNLGVFKCKFEEIAKILSQRLKILFGSHICMETTATQIMRYKSKEFKTFSA